MKKLAVIVITIAMLTQLTGCLTKKSETSSEAPYTSAQSNEEFTADDTSSTLATDLPEPDFTQREPYDSPFEFPYDKEGMHEYMIDYANELGMIYKSSMTGDQATTAVILKSRAAAHGRAFETWFKEEIDDIISTARSLGKSAEDIEYNILIADSTEYECEYDITIIASY